MSKFYISACILLILSATTKAQNNFDQHIGGSINEFGLTSYGYPFSGDYALYGHFLPEIKQFLSSSIDVTIQPNPFTVGFTVQCEEARIQRLYLLDLYGRTLITSMEPFILAPEIPSGSYYVLIETSIGNVAKTIIKAK
tara:strand:- start:716 stop:1132 length:417 start_codon:yes stop_codon:yes gene_type:complete